MRRGQICVCKREAEPCYRVSINTAFRFHSATQNVYGGLTLCRSYSQGKYSKMQILKPSIESHPTIHRLRPRFLMVSRASHHLTLASCSRITHYHRSHNLQMPRGRVSTEPIAASKELSAGVGRGPILFHGPDLPGQVERATYTLRGLCDIPAPGPASLASGFPSFPLGQPAASFPTQAPSKLRSPPGRGSTHWGCPHRRTEMGSLPWAHTSFLLQASASWQKSQCLRGQPRGAGRGQAAPRPPVLFCSLEGEGLVLSLPVLTTGLFCVFSDRARIINSTRLLCKLARPFIAVWWWGWWGYQLR